MHGAEIGDRGLIVLFLVFFCYFRSFFRFPSPLKIFLATPLPTFDKLAMGPDEQMLYFKKLFFNFPCNDTKRKFFFTKQFQISHVDQ